MHFEDVDETVTFYIGPPPQPDTPPPPQRPIRATLGTAMNNYYPSPEKIFTHYRTYLDCSTCTSGSGEDV